jgi:hypothetical protein
MNKALNVEISRPLCQTNQAQHDWYGLEKTRSKRFISIQAVRGKMAILKAFTVGSAMNV